MREIISDNLSLFLKVLTIHKYVINLVEQRESLDLLKREDYTHVKIGGKILLTHKYSLNQEHIFDAEILPSRHNARRRERKYKIATKLLQSVISEIKTFIAANSYKSTTSILCKAIRINLVLNYLYNMGNPRGIISAKISSYIRSILCDLLIEFVKLNYAPNSCEITSSI